jgi:hypothetical protein
MKIGIEINGVLRDTILKFRQVYEKVMIDTQDDETQSSSFQIDMSGNTEEEVLPEPFEYKVISEVDSLDLIDHFSFRDKNEFFSFMYEEHPMEIFGHSPSTEMLTFNILNDLYLELRNSHEIHIISDEIGKSKPASLFFLSKFGCLVENVSFYNEITKNDVLSKFDLIVTSNPDVIINYGDKIDVIKFNTCYNVNIESKHSISSIKDLKEKIKQLENA